VDTYQRLRHKIRRDRVFLLASAIVLVWTATRLSTSLRQVLEIVFEVPKELQPGWLEGKLHDVRIVLLGGTLLAITVASTSVLHWAGGRALSASGMADGLPRVVATWLAVPVGLLVSVAMFYVVYRFVPGSRVAPLDAAIAAVFAGVLFELAKQAFVLWIPHSRQLDLYGSVAGLVAAALWIHSSAVFVAGAEIASARRGARESSSP